MGRYDLLIVNRSFWPAYPVIGEGLLRVAESFAFSKKVAVILQNHTDINKHLKEFRPNNYREFFDITLLQSIEAVKFIGKNYT